MKSFSIYVHIPYCLSKCPYCDFNSYAAEAVPEDYIDALIREIAMRRQETDIHDKTLKSIYIGGGTPSILSKNQLAKILNNLFDTFPKRNKHVETTIEVNPGSTEGGKLMSFMVLGINRLNIGVQSFSDKNLKLLGRIHTSSDSQELLKKLGSSKFKNFGLDLIYSLPGQTVKDWIGDLKTAVSLNPRHISCYSLTLENNVPMIKMLSQNELREPDEDTQLEMFLSGREFLKKAGFLHYEISNFSKPYYYSKHNKNYWQRGTYLGFGAGAHSFNPHREARSWNIKNPHLYIKTLQANTLPVDGIENLTLKQSRLESLMLGLRTLEGISLKNTFNDDLAGEIQSLIHKYRDLDLMEVKGNRASLTGKGLFLSESIVENFSQYL